MVSSNILQRTFRIKYENKEGTCFTIDQDGRQYVITSGHLINGISDSNPISIFHEKKWKEVPIKLVGFANTPVDIAVLALSFQLSPSHPLATTTGAGIYLSQDVYFLGFPFGLHIEVGPDLNRDFPLPLVKKGIVSGFIFDQDGFTTLLLDGHINPGFSGGPVVYIDHDTGELNVAGVIAGYHYEWQNVYYKNQGTSLRFMENTGIILGYSIRYAIRLIKTNPIGFLL